MKKYKVLKDFQGSQDGSTVEQFNAGEVVCLSAGLAAVVEPEGWVKEVVKREKAVVVPKETLKRTSKRKD